MILQLAFVLVLNAPNAVAAATGESIFTRLPSNGDSIFNFLGFGDQQQRNELGTARRGPRKPPTAQQIGDRTDTRVLQSRTAINITAHGEPCRSVVNQRADIVMVPYKLKAEWDSIQANPPQDVKIGPCYCGRGLSYNEVTNYLIEVMGIGKDPQAVTQPLPVLPGYWAPFSSFSSTTNKICHILGCGDATSVVSKAFNDPSDDAILVWTGTQWLKFPATAAGNSKLNHETPTTLSCAMPPPAPP